MSKRPPPPPPYLPPTIPERVHTLWLAMFGFSGTNGVQAEVERLDEQVEKLSEWQRDAERTAALVRWLALGVVSLLGLTMTDFVVGAARLIINAHGGP